ncbi:hypothetical protein Cantr_07353 [Candida viswanathii]|uniref:Uncharacterized protein n=1 Tax=Candida viswanathii TaxID=5486 RepID=A0A367Y1C5_9ASCO|nr:hypothetical protein Cantr_07353 [Candida viswanathii]
MATLCDSFPGLLQLYHQSLFDLVVTYDLYLAYKIRQILTLINLELTLSESSRTRLEKNWMVLQNSIMMKDKQLWNGRKVLNEIMSTMIDQGTLFNHNIVYELQMVQLKFDDLIEGGDEDVFDSNNIELQLLDSNPICLAEF